MNKIKKMNLKHWIVILLMLVISLLLLFFSENLNSAISKNMISNIASAILISGIIGVFDKVFMAQSFIESICQRVDLKNDIDKLKIINITTDANNKINYKEYINKSKKSIDIIHIRGEHWTNDNIEYILDNISKKATTVRILLLDPEAHLAQVLALQYESSIGDIKQKTNQVVEFWKKKYNERKKRCCSNNFEGKLELYFTKGNINTAFYRLDDFLISVHINSNSSTKSNVIPAIIMKNNYDEESLYSVYLNEINELFEGARLEWSSESN
ncbi:hypothetical protein UT300017_11640 [Clostridium sp. CTA-17]